MDRGELVAAQAQTAAQPVITRERAGRVPAPHVELGTATRGIQGDRAILVHVDLAQGRTRRFGLVRPQGVERPVHAAPGTGRIPHQIPDLDTGDDGQVAPLVGCHLLERAPLAVDQEELARQQHGHGLVLGHLHDERVRQATHDLGRRDPRVGRDRTRQLVQIQREQIRARPQPHACAQAVTVHVGRRRKLEHPRLEPRRRQSVVVTTLDTE